VRRIVVSIAGAAVAVPLALASPAQAVVDPSAPIWYEVDVIGVSSTGGVVRYDQELGRCGGGQTAISCTVSAQRTATRTIGATFGISAAGVAASLGISSATAVTISSTCGGSIAPPTYPWIVGYASGTTYKYTIRKRTYQYGKLTQTATSTQYAFNPLGIHCARAS
jgi:hypothetical protein